MLELGVGVVAICLPALRPIFRGKSVEGMLRSLRSFVSLRSFTSLPNPSRQGSGPAYTEGKFSGEHVDRVSSKSGSSDRNLVARDVTTATETV